MASQAIQSLRRVVTIQWPANANENAQALLLRVAKEGHARIMREQAARAGVIPEFDNYGDYPGRPIERAEKRIVYRYRYLREVVLTAMRELERQSPVESERYKRSHTLWINGQAAALSTPIKAADEVFIANPVPYARRLEVGKTQTGRDFLISVPNRIYERVAKLLISRYRNAAAISSGYVTLPGAWVIRGGLPATYPIGGGRHRKRRQRVGERVRAPAIFIQAHS